MKNRLLVCIATLFSLFLSLFPFSPVQAFSPVVTPTPPPITPPPPPPLLPQPAIAPRPVAFPEIRYQRVEVNIEGQVALTRVEMLFVNKSPIIQEGTYLFPLPAEATISSLTMWADGQRMVGEILDKDKARQIYENIVRQRRDPALLQYIGSRAVELRVFPIPPQGERKIELEYSLILKKEAGLIKYLYPLAGTAFTSQTLKELTLTVRLNASEPIRNIYSPSHEVSLSRRGERQAEVSYEASNISRLKDFELYYSVADSEVALNLLTYKSGDKGYFMLLASPRLETSKDAVVARDVVLVIDVSGSMGGVKIEQAKQALKFILNRLNPEDRFNIISFSSQVDKFATSLRPVSERAKALDYVDGLRAAGSTNIHEAILSAMGLLSTDRSGLVIFITDGQPTVGITDEKQIVASVERASLASLRLFTFGIGDDVNASLLDLLAQQNHGISQYVRRDDQVQPIITSFYEKISSPVLIGPALDFGPVKVADVYPHPLPDLYLGSQLVIVGQYRQGGEATISLEGTANGKKQKVVSQKTAFSDAAKEASFIPRLWASRKIGYLLDQVRLRGASQEVIEEIRTLSAEYGIMTPYTSYFIQENVPTLVTPRTGMPGMPGVPMPTPAPTPAWGQSPAALAPAPVSPQYSGGGAGGNIVAPMGPAGPAGRDGASGKPSPSPSPIAQSQEAQRLKQSQTGDTGLAPQVRAIADKTFVYKNGQWTDTKFKEGMLTVEIAFGSQEYFKLMQKHPEWGRYFSLGEKMVVILDGQAYVIKEGGADQPYPAPNQNVAGAGSNPTQGQLNPNPATLPGKTEKAADNPSEKAMSEPGDRGQLNIFQQIWNWLASLFRR